MTSTRPPAATRRWAAAAIVLVLLALIAATANPVVQAVSGRSIGALMAEQSGRLRYDRYDRAALVPAGVLPDWFPEDATAVTVVQPGPRRGSGESIRVDAVVPVARTMRSLSAACRPSTSLTVPFPLPSDWPRYSMRDLRTCGDWSVLARAGHLYLWRELPAG